MIKKILFAILLLPSLTQAKYIVFGEPNNIEIPEFTIQQKKEDAFNLEQLKTKGYIERNMFYPRKMLGMRTKVKFTTSKDNENTELRQNLNEVKLAFEYKQKTNNPIGFAPIMTYAKKGWTGIKEFFDAKYIGVCSLSTINMKLAGETVLFPEETIKYDVNNKITAIIVEGSNNTGFDYRISWYDSIYNKELECANMIYDKEITNQMIALAKELDKK